MEKQDFQLDTHREEKPQPSGRTRVLLGTALFLTGFGALGGVITIFAQIHEKGWLEIGVVAFAWNVIFALCCVISLAGLVRIALDLGEGRVFSRTLAGCVWIIGSLVTAASVIIPRLPDYQSSGYEIFSRGSFVLIDGAILVPGLLLIILATLIREGFRMQKEAEEIL